MDKGDQILKAISELNNSFNEFKEETEANFKRVNKRLDGVENELNNIKFELKKIDTILGYQQQYDNIPT